MLREKSFHRSLPFEPWPVAWWCMATDSLEHDPIKQPLFQLEDLNPVVENLLEFAGPASEEGKPEFELCDLETPDGETAATSAETFANCEREARTAEGWKLGRDTGPWVVPRWKPLLGQAQVLVCNAFLNLSKVPKNILQSVSGFFPMTERKVKSTLLHVAGKLLGLPASTVQGIVRKVKKNGWKPCVWEKAAGVTKDTASHPAPSESHETILQRLVREALFHCATGQSDVDYIRAVCRLQLSGCNMGSKYHSVEFISLVEYIGSIALQICDASEFHHPMPGHGMKSMCSIGFDIGNLGRAMFSKHEFLGRSFYTVLISSGFYLLHPSSSVSSRFMPDHI